MGCFSFKCKECNTAVNSNSVTGQEVKLYLLANGVVKEQMSGQYDSYGRVFNNSLSDSISWRTDWSDVCDLMFSKNEGDGIAAIHKECFTGAEPETQSEDDPNQGWGFYEEATPDETLNAYFLSEEEQAEEDFED